MASAILDKPLIIKKNSDFSFELDWVDTQYNEIDISDFRVWFKVRRWEGADTLLEMSTDNEKAYVVGSTMVFTATADDTKDMEVSEPNFDIHAQYRDSNNKDRTVMVLTGKVSIIADYS